jgi:hypothetical protein
MVDFNNDKTVSTAPKNLLQILILQRRHDFQEALEQCKLDNGVDTGLAQARGYDLVLELASIIDKHISKDRLAELIKLFLDKDLTLHELTEIFLELTHLLYALNITKVDTKQTYDAKDAEDRNRHMGYK